MLLPLLAGGAGPSKQRACCDLLSWQAADAALYRSRRGAAVAGWTNDSSAVPLLRARGRAAGIGAVALHRCREPVVDRRDRLSARAKVANVSTTMMTAEPMIARGAHYTALLDTIDHRGATKLNAREREQLVEAADVLLFGEPDSERTVRWAEVLIEELETSKRWSVESCDRLREHLHGCGAPIGAS